ncbi:hypothetical protein JTB14_009281 [Gonioctena quinquepunctata]|nr:hypothetical protein JTB14_009281 [Gonioctena quinquepunctata]
MNTGACPRPKFNYINHSTNFNRISRSCEPIMKVIVGLLALAAVVAFGEAGHLGGWSSGLGGYKSGWGSGGWGSGDGGQVVAIYVDDLLVLGSEMSPGS